jgi:hypothetical protein
MPLRSGHTINVDTGFNVKEGESTVIKSRSGQRMAMLSSPAVAASVACEVICEKTPLSEAYEYLELDARLNEKRVLCHG